MKQLRLEPIDESAPLAPPAVAQDLRWVDDIAALLPDHLRVGWYRNVKPWIATLPPHDEVAHLAYAMGYLGLLIREAPPLVAAERVKLEATIQRLSGVVNESLSAAAGYHQLLEERLVKLPAEIAAAVNSAETDVKIQVVETRAGKMLVQHVKDCAAGIRGELQKDIVNATKKARELINEVKLAHEVPNRIIWASIGLFCALALFLSGVWFGRLTPGP
jgi:hypothetical protein